MLLAIAILLAARPQEATAARSSSTKPNAPILVSPANGVTVESTKPTLSWKDGGGAKNYTIEVAEATASVKADGSFSAPLVRQTGLSSTSYTLTSALSEGKTYAWHVLAKNSAGSSPWSKTRTFKVQTPSEFSYSRQSDPARTVVSDSAGKWVATFTDKAYTVTLVGPSRTFTERAERDGVTYAATVTGSTWVRALPKPYDGGQVDEGWLKQALSNTSPDVLGLAMQYIEKASNLYEKQSDGTDLKVAGDADYGPLQSDGTRQEGSDFNDYLGIKWTYGSTTDQPEADQINSLDCSGFMRMVFGYRSKLPLSLSEDGGASIPRRAYQILDSAPGVVTVPNTGQQATNFEKLATGDLVFFDAATDDGTQIDHVGMYLGQDSDGNQRFISSRKSINGPTLGDYKGKSILNGTGLYASSFRAVRRL